MLRCTTLFCVFLLLNGLTAQEDGKTFSIGQEYTLQSGILDEERPYLVYLPLDYEEEKKDYPVLYLLDGRGNFHHTTACVDFLTRNGRIPGMIVVGIPNLDDHRTRDLTPDGETIKENFPTGGGASHFLAFIEKELMPHIDQTYRTMDYKTLVGHSFGGLFAIHAFVHHPDIFDSYIAISPSLWWDDQKLVLEEADAYLKEAKDLKGHLYMTMGSETGTMLGGAWKLAALLEEKNYPDFHWHFERMTDENHISVPYRSTIKGLRFIFDQWFLDEKRELMLAGGIDAVEEHGALVDKLYRLPPNWTLDRLTGLGEMLLNKGQAKKAVPILAKATKMFPEAEMAWFKYGESLAKVGEKEAAVQSLQKVLDIKSDHFQSLALLKQLGEDVSDYVPDVKLSQKELHTYTADYLLEMGMTLKITSDGKQLWAEAPILEKEELVAMGEHRFFVISKNSTIIFQADGEKITGLTVETPGGNFVGTQTNQ